MLMNSVFHLSDEEFVISSFKVYKVPFLQLANTARMYIQKVVKRTPKLLYTVLQLNLRDPVG